MAARTFNINFENQSGFALRRIDHGTSHGIWTNQPPIDIPAGTRAEWQSESNGFMTGTEARVVYQIRDKGVTGSLIGNSAPCLTLKWVNPYIGSPDANHSIAPCPDLLLSDQPQGDRQTYQLQISASQTGEEKWTEWAAALLTGPAQLFHSSHPVLWVRLIKGTVARKQQGLDIQPPDEPVSVRGVKGGPVNAWSGTWAEGNPSAPANLLQIAAAGAELATARFDVTARDERSASPATFNGAGPVSYPHLPIYRGDFRQSASHVDVIGPGVPKLDIPIGIPGKFKPGGVVKVIPKKVLVPIELLGSVDTIRLDDHRWLQLFQEFRGERATGYRLRYFRTDSNEHTLLDLMLHPKSVIK